MRTELEKAIVQTVRYFDLFGLPVTATQIFRCLITYQTQVFSEYVSLVNIQRALLQSDYLREVLGNKWGYYFLRGKDYLVEERLRRHNVAQDKWKIARRVHRFLVLVPFVVGMAGSGSLALDNTKPSSDLDEFVIVKAGKIWTTRLLLLIVAQLSGRRRKYWNRLAPDKICLNHYVTESHEPVAPEVQNVYTATQYVLHVPVFGRQALLHFREVNSGWMDEYVTAPILPDVLHGHEVRLNASLVTCKKFVEDFLSEPIGAGIENIAERVQRFIIGRHRGFSLHGRVVLNATELAFHPDTKVPAILRQFQEQQNE